MKSTAILVVLFTAAVAMKLEESHPVERKPLEQSTGRCAEYGIDYSGYDLEIVTDIHHWHDCAYRCRDHRACSYWSWSANSYKCWLRSSDSGRHHVGQVISGSYTCLSECEE